MQVYETGKGVFYSPNTFDLTNYMIRWQYFLKKLEDQFDFLDADNVPDMLKDA